jgi:hypothetical protein
MELVAQNELVETPATHLEASRTYERGTGASCTWFRLGGGTNRIVDLAAARDGG